MTRSFHPFNCEGEQLAGTLDEGTASTGLLIVSGGNEIRSGAHAGMSRLAQKISAEGYPVFRYDRRGIGDSSGANLEFLESAAEISTAVEHFRQISPQIKKIIAFGNCDAATALTLFGEKCGIEGLILANPWVIETKTNDSTEPTGPPPAAIRARYWERLKNPKTIVDLLNGQIDFKKLLAGLRKASQKIENNELSLKLYDAFLTTKSPCRLLLAERDTTALAFLSAWNSADYGDVRNLPNIELKRLDSASHSFADKASKIWLESQILKTLQSA